MTGVRAAKRGAPGRGWWVSAQAVPPARAAATIARPRLERRLDEAATRRLTALVAGAGFGKSTLLAAWTGSRRAAWYTLTEADRDLGHVASGLLGALGLRVPALPGAVAGVLEQTLGPEAVGDERARARACAGLLADALATFLPRELVLVLDDFQELGSADPGSWLIEALCRQAPEHLRMIVASRDPLPFSIERLRGQGQATLIAGGALAFEVEDVGAMVEAALGGPEAGLAAELHGLTGGWPAAVRLAIEALADVPPAERPAVLRRLIRPTGPIYDYLADEVLGREAPGVRELLSAVATLPRFNAALCDALRIRGAAASLRSLEARGLFVQPIGDGDWYTLHPLIREHLVGRTEAMERQHRLSAAAAWFEAAGEYRDALTCWSGAGDQLAVARLLEAHGPAMLSGGDVGVVAEAAAAVPADLRSPAIDRLEGQARQIRGDWEGALACFRRVASPGRTIDPGLAWRMGLIHHLRGELDDALATYGRGRSNGGDARDVALLHAWLAAALWLRGDADACRAEARRALEAAGRSRDDEALAAAHTTAAMVAALDGDRRGNDAHYLRALDHASRAGDLLQAIRIRANRGSRLVEEGYCEEALDELREAIRLAEVAGFAAFHALALSNRGDALRRLGRFEEAIADLEASRGLYQRLESRFVSYPLAHLGDVHAERGATAVAMASYEEAIAVAEAPGDVQGLRPALAGLAELLADQDPERARALADRAGEFGPGIGVVRALLARGRVALRAGERSSSDAAAATIELARAAAAEARVRRDRAGLAEALELEAEATADRAAAIALLDEALQLWRVLHAPVAAARSELRRAEVAGEPEPAGAIEALGRAGAAARRASAPGGWAGETAGLTAVAIRTLGGFEVLRGEQPVPIAEWGSRKARDLLKILISRRHQHVPREELEELLWPAEGPGRTSRRLSAALSTARAVLDPGHRRPAGWYVAADRSAVWLEGAHVALDVEDFLASATIGLGLESRGAAEAAETLRAAESAYRGDYLVEDAFEDWSAALREECRQVYSSVAHALARLASAEGDQPAATRFLRRALERDEFDERAHLGLVSALASGGQPAEARRAYAAYLARMEELGVEAAPFPG
ncbi:MAG: tetratricopeptide repeat protein [Chloroflexi bacterium]|nr:tetratricopeptide repeat protein [Chloroflexota bacterium]